jgi:hypothetical protein
MQTSRIRVGHPYGETPPNTFVDFDWAKANENQLLERYGECVILVYQQQVIGKGSTLQEAEEDAEKNLPSEMSEATPVTVFLHQRHPFFRIYPEKS